MLIEALAAGIIGVALLWLVLQPILGTPQLALPHLDPLDPEETPQGQALLALKEIEFDRATGKLSDDDFAELTARYSAAAIATLDAPPSVLRCLTHGPRAEADAHFCPECGAGLVTENDACAACNFAVQPDAAFCAGCGVRLQADPGETRDDRRQT